MAPVYRWWIMRGEAVVTEGSEASQLVAEHAAWVEFCRLGGSREGLVYGYDNDGDD